MGERAVREYRATRQRPARRAFVVANLLSAGSSRSILSIGIVGSILGVGSAGSSPSQREDKADEP